MKLIYCKEVYAREKTVLVTTQIKYWKIKSGNPVVDFCDIWIPKWALNDLELNDDIAEEKEKEIAIKNGYALVEIIGQGD